MELLNDGVCTDKTLFEDDKDCLRETSDSNLYPTENSINASKNINRRKSDASGERDLADCDLNESQVLTAQSVAEIHGNHSTVEDAPDFTIEAQLKASRLSLDRATTDMTDDILMTDITNPISNSNIATSRRFSYLPPSFWDVQGRRPSVGRVTGRKGSLILDDRVMFTSNQPSISATSVERVRLIVCPGSRSDDDLKERLSAGKHCLFAQLDVLCHFDDETVGWKETARWLKYEERVEAGGRWSKPHVSTVSLHALLELRRAIKDGVCIINLDLNAESSSLPHFAKALTDVLVEERRLSDDAAHQVFTALCQPHKHKHRRSNNATNTTKNEAKNSNKNLKIKNQSINTTASSSRQCPEHLNGLPSESRRSTSPAVAAGSATILLPAAALAVCSSVAAALVHHQHQLQQRRKSLVRRDGKDYWANYTTYRHGERPDNLIPYTQNLSLMKKIPEGAEAACILIGLVDFLSEPIVAFCRLRTARIFDGLIEVDVASRFIVLALGPKQNSSISEYSELGRATAALLNDEVFIEVAYRASTRQDLLDGMDEFLDDLRILPPSIWDPTSRLDPPKKPRPKDKIWKRLNTATRHVPSPETMTSQGEDDECLKRTGRLFGGLKRDINRRAKCYVSDFTDGLHLQCLASIIFLYFACITPIVTFGGMMGQKTDGYMGTMEMLVSGALCGVLFALFSGQPLNIIGATGPLLVFESIIYQICKENGIDFLPFRFWIGVWVFVYLIVLVAFDLSALVRYITRFTEESFAVLISIIFIYEACSKILEIWHTHPVHIHPGTPSVNYSCHCASPPLDSTDLTLEPPSSTDSVTYDVVTNDVINKRNNNSISVFSLSRWIEMLPEDCITYRGRVLVGAGCASVDACEAAGWTLNGGAACQDETIVQAVPDVFLLSCVLFAGTFTVALFFKTLRSTRFFPTQVRTLLGDFAVFLSVVTWTSVDALFGLATPKLNVPAELKPTREKRDWFVRPFPVTYWWLIPLAAVPGVLATILVFLDQQITAVIVNRKEHKLKKGHGYHLDLFVLAFLIAISSAMGLPWFVAATVRAITHVRSLVRESEVRAPGERPQMLGVREQRVTGICIHLLIGFSTLLTPILRHIPMPVLYGVFMYMGVTSLRGVQFIERVLIMFMPVKYQPDYLYLRRVPTLRVHYFTIVQLTCFTVMWIIKSVKITSIGFPLMLLALVAARRTMDFLFTQRDLYWLDHLLPDETRRKQDDVITKSVERDRLYSENDECIVVRMPNTDRRPE